MNYVWPKLSSTFWYLSEVISDEVEVFIVVNYCFCFQFDFDKQFSEMREMMNPLMSMFGNLLGFDPFAGLSSQPEKPLAIEGESDKVVQPVFKEEEEIAKSEPETVTLEQILRDMGILVSDDKVSSECSNICLR